MSRRHSLHGLMRWIQRDEWSEAYEEVLACHLGPACSRADIDVVELPSIIGEDFFMTLWGCAFEDFLARDLEDGRNIVDDYLKRRGWKEIASDRAYMAALRRSTMSLYEVSEIVPGASFLARDLVRGGEPVRVTEHSATRALKQWDRIGARVVSAGRNTVIGGGLLVYSRDAGEAIRDIIRNSLASARDGGEKLARENERATYGAPPADAVDEGAALRAAAPAFTTIWLGDLLQRQLDRALPEVRNSDGEALEFWTLRYPFGSGAARAEVRSALDKIPTLRPEGDAFWNWVDEEAQPRSTKRSAGANAKGLSFVTTMEDGAVVLGTVQLKGKSFTFSVNSSGRAQRGRALLEAALSGLVGTPTVEKRGLEELAASRSAKGSKATKASTGFSPDEKRLIVRRTLDRHYADVLENPVPVLGNVTPREAARTESGRAKVVDWLKGLENVLADQPEGDPMGDYDPTWLWEELGVADRRK